MRDVQVATPGQDGSGGATVVPQEILKSLQWGGLAGPHGEGQLHTL